VAKDSASVKYMTAGSDDTASQDLIAIRTFLSESEADIAKAALEAFGVECMLSHDDCGGQRPHLNLAGGIRLLVRSNDAEQAEEVLSGSQMESGLD
jgi:hypothetical protein